jgi:hypothetical protein
LRDATKNKLTPFSLAFSAIFRTAKIENLLRLRSQFRCFATSNNPAHLLSRSGPAVRFCKDRHKFATGYSTFLAADARLNNAPARNISFERIIGHFDRFPHPHPIAAQLSKSWRFFATYGSFKLAHY